MTPITLWDEASASKLWGALKGWKAAANVGKPFTVSVRIQEDQRSLEQNKRYWAILQIIEDCAPITGQKFTREAWHHFFRLKFLPCLDGPEGLIIPSSTTKLTIQEMAEYMTKVEAWAGENLQIDFMEAM